LREREIRRSGMEMDGNILYFIEGSKELLPGYVKTSKGNNTTERNIPHTIKAWMEW
jgi:hypothetical protein